MTDISHLESVLASLAKDIDWPDPSPHFARRVAARIESGPTRERQSGRRRLAVALAVVAVFVGVMVFSPAARQAVADLLGAAGIRIMLTSEPIPVVGGELELGQPIELGDIANEADFVVRAPSGVQPGRPGGVYLSENGQVTMVWAGDETLPAAGDSGIGLLLTQSRAGVGPELAFKGVGPNAEISQTIVEGASALWIEGAPHTLTLLDREGNPIEETTRLAANVLLWEVNGVNHRLETTGDLASALAIVEALQPIS